MKDTEGYHHIFESLYCFFSTVRAYPPNNTSLFAGSVTGNLGLGQGQNDKICELHVMWAIDWENWDAALIHENKQFIESIAATVEDAESGQMCIHGITSPVEHPVMDLADTLPLGVSWSPWISCSDSQTSFPNDASYWHSTNARPKAFNPARNKTQETAPKPLLGRGPEETISHLIIITILTGDSITTHVRIYHDWHSCQGGSTFYQPRRYSSVFIQSWSHFLPLDMTD